MKIYFSILGSALAAAALCTATQATAGEVTAADEAMVTKWAQGVDKDQDHLLSKAEVLALVERAFAAADARKTGKLDMKQVAVMLREFDPRAVGVRPTLPKP
jgi:hypothetical protein